MGSYSSIGPFGTYDMAGNAQEWAWNEADSAFRFILAGGWNSPTYQFNQPDAKPPFDRGAANGRTEVVKEVLSWLDQSLGPVAR